MSPPRQSEPVIALIVPQGTPSASSIMADVLARVGSIALIEASADGDDHGDVADRLSDLRPQIHVFEGTEEVAGALVSAGLRNALVVPHPVRAMARDDAFWRRLVNCRVACFSRKLHNRLQALGLNAAHFEHWPNNAVEPSSQDERAAFLWLPPAGAVPDMLTDLCLALRLERLQLAPNAIGVSALQRLRRRVRPLQMTIEEGTDIDATAPRFEIFCDGASDPFGSSVRAALARGAVVVAPAAPPFDEAIAHFASGLLLVGDHCHRSLIAEERLAQLSDAARRRATFGHREWLADRERLISFALGEGRRWADGDVSAHFGNRLQSAARARRLRAMSEAAGG